MTDIVERLRNPTYHKSSLFAQAYMHEAADLIESLRSEAEAMRQKAISNARERNAAEATCEKLAKALEDALSYEPKDDSCAPWVSDAKAALSEYRKEASE
ncbi:MAG: hypothetical protein AAAB20_07840 [Rhizobium sp.]|uniref:hypothetical protein n=1 Tax=Rhizobium sp. TaxID=391 RepID=UPI0030F1B9E5